MDLKSCNMTMGMTQSTGPRRKDARGKEEMSQSTLKGLQEKENQWLLRNFLAWSSLSPSH